jgi:sugar phosphate permease
VFALAMFSSAALIFVLEPLFTRLVMPLLGGSPEIWNSSMAFFQAALLGGYLYAHLLARLKSLRLQAALHAGVLLLAALALPLRVSGLFGPPDYQHPALWLLCVLAVSVGAPFAAASATAPLLQAWYARSGRGDAYDPYYLYAASNFGSLTGLLGYPALAEPLLGIKAQGAAWQAGYAAVIILTLLAAVTAVLAGAQPGPEEAGSTPALA